MKMGIKIQFARQLSYFGPSDLRCSLISLVVAVIEARRLEGLQEGRVEGIRVIGHSQPGPSRPS